jgi:hypothetical protein
VAISTGNLFHQFRFLIENTTTSIKSLMLLIKSFKTNDFLRFNFIFVDVMHSTRHQEHGNWDRCDKRNNK